MSDATSPDSKDHSTKDGATSGTTPDGGSTHSSGSGGAGKSGATSKPSGTGGKSPKKDAKSPQKDDKSPQKDGKSPQKGDEASSKDDSDDEGGIENLLAFMKDKLKIGGSKTKKDKIGPVLSSPDVASVVEYILSGRCKNIISMAGAGISTSAGIPDFRSEGSGLYHNLQKYDLPHPQAIFELGFFRQNPQPFFTLAKELYPGSFTPTPSHYFIKLLHNKGLLLRHYTQNIDTLEHVAEIPESKLIEAHGSFRTAHCLDCRELYTQDWVKDEIFADRVPACTACNGIVKPDIVFFGESLPQRFFVGLRHDFPVCDLLIVMGTSLTVQPFASLVDNVPSSCPRLLLNREAVGEGTGFVTSLQDMLGTAGGLKCNKKGNTRDVALLADCDDACHQLATSLGWQADLEELIKEGNKKVEGK